LIKFSADSLVLRSRANASGSAPLDFTSVATSLSASPFRAANTSPDKSFASLTAVARPIRSGVSHSMILSNGRERVSVALDLRNGKTGVYFLSTSHEQDRAAYYYPLSIR